MAREAETTIIDFLNLVALPPRFRETGSNLTDSLDFMTSPPSGKCLNAESIPASPGIGENLCRAPHSQPVWLSRQRLSEGSMYGRMAVVLPVWASTISSVATRTTFWPPFD